MYARIHHNMNFKYRRLNIQQKSHVCIKLYIILAQYVHCTFSLVLGNFDLWQFSSKTKFFKYHIRTLLIQWKPITQIDFTDFYDSIFRLILLPVFFVAHCVTSAFYSEVTL